MNTQTLRYAPAAGFARLAALIHRFVHGALGLARALDRRLAAWQRGHIDRDALRAMSDRELADIGVPRASVDAAADRRWRRDRFGGPSAG